MTTLVKGFYGFLGLKFHELSISEKLFGWLTVFSCADIFGKIKEKKERGQYFNGILLYSHGAQGDL